MRELITKGEISKLLNISKSQIRFYEKKGLLTPIIDDNGYAMYSYKDIYKLDMILFLREIDTPVNAVKETIDDGSGYDYLDILKDADKKLQQEIKALQKKRKNIKKRIAIFEDRDIDRFSIKYFEERTIFMSDESFDYVSPKRAFELTQKYGIDYRDLNNELCHIIAEDKSFVTGLIADKNKDYDAPKTIIPAGRYLTYSFYFKNHKEQLKKRAAFNDYVNQSDYQFEKETYFIDYFAQTYYRFENFVVTLQKRIIED